MKLDELEELFRIHSSVETVTKKEHKTGYLISSSLCCRLK